MDLLLGPNTNTWIWYSEWIHGFAFSEVNFGTVHLYIWTEVGAGSGSWNRLFCSDLRPVFQYLVFFRFYGPARDSNSVLLDLWAWILIRVPKLLSKMWSWCREFTVAVPNTDLLMSKYNLIRIRPNTWICSSDQIRIHGFVCPTKYEYMDSVQRQIHV